jgi:hypothetical protein
METDQIGRLRDILDAARRKRRALPSTVSKLPSVILSEAKDL